MELITPYLLPSIVIIIVLSLLGFFLPFIKAIFVKPTMSVWGFWLGSRHRVSVLKNPITKDDSNPSSSPNNIIHEIFKEEKASLKNFHDEIMKNIDNRLQYLENKQKEKKEEYKNWQQYSDQRFLGRKFKFIEKEISEFNIKNIFLLLAITVIIIIDALIAKHVFVSLGLFTAETLKIGSKEFQDAYPLIYGAFLTIIIAVFLHFALQLTMLKNFFYEKKWGKGIVVGILLSFFLLLLLAVLIPDIAKPLIEIAMREAWAIGVISVYWLGEQTIGEEKDYKQLILPILIVVLLLGWIVFGFTFLISLIFGKIFDMLSDFFIGIKKVRTQREKKNEIIRYTTLSQSYRRGMFY